jgi:hypothetical protein
MKLGNVKTFTNSLAVPASFAAILFFVASTVLFVSGCTEPPDPVGINAIPQSDFSSFEIDTIYGTALPSIYNIVNTLGSDRILLGKYRTYESWICIKFYYWPDSLVGATITSAAIQLKASYHFGTDTTAALPFSLYRAISSWTGSTFNLDSLQQRPGDYYDPNPIGTQTLQSSSDTDWVNIDIPDTALVRTWFSTNVDTLNLNNGLILRPTANMNIIRGFNSFAISTDTLMPRLIISYIDTNGNTISGVDVGAIGFSRFVSTVNSAGFPGNSQRIYIQNGVSYRGFVSFDDLPVNSVPSLFKATLEVTLDSSSSIFNSYTNEAFFVQSIGTNDSADGLALSLSQTPVGINGQRVYRTDVISFVRLWLTDRSSRKILLSGVDENRALDLFTLYGSDPSVAQSLRPRIIIYYGLNH